MTRAAASLPAALSAAPRQSPASALSARWHLPLSAARVLRTAVVMRIEKHLRAVGALLAAAPGAGEGIFGAAPGVGEGPSACAAAAAGERDREHRRDRQGGSRRGQPDAAGHRHARRQKRRRWAPPLPVARPIVRRPAAAHRWAGAAGLPLWSLPPLPLYDLAGRRLEGGAPAAGCARTGVCAIPRS